MSEKGALRKRIDKPSVSVVIPTYNRANDLRRCLDSLRAQTIDDFEVLICDDGSTDGTAEVWKEYSQFLDVTYDFAENWGGPARPRNRGIALARAPYVAFLDSDDWWAPRKLETSLEYLERGADVVYHDLHFANATSKKHLWRRARTRKLKKPAFDDLLINGSAITNSSVVLRKALIEKIGGFAEEKSLIATEDYDAWLRIARITEKFDRIPATLGYYWTGGGNISNPKRILAILDALEARYSNAVQVGRAYQDIQWINYAKGRAYYGLKSYELARKYLQMIHWPQAPLDIVFNSKKMLLLIKLRENSK